MSITQSTAGAGGGEITLADLHAANTARQAEWCSGGDPEPDLAFRGNELAGETGEACNVIKKLERERHGWRGSRATKEQLAEELADVVICADLCAVTADIDLAAAVQDKFNATSEKVGLTTKLAALASAPPAGQGNGTPAGWKLVPVEPTQAMIGAGGEACQENCDMTMRAASMAYRAMIASAPPAPTPDAGSDLAKLSAAAAKGEWLLDVQTYYDEDGGPSEDHTEGVMVLDNDDQPDSIVQCSEANAKFIAAIVNAYRAGRLVEAPMSNPTLTGQDEARRALVKSPALVKNYKEALADKLERIAGDWRYSDEALAGLVREYQSVILAALRAPSLDRGAEEMRERAAALALTDCRSDVAKQFGVYPDCFSYGIDVAKAIRALPVPNEGEGK